jgi:hypothetical protein
MRNNKTKHEILKVLFKKRESMELIKKPNTPYELGLSKIEIIKSINIKSLVFENSIPELLKNNEIGIGEKELEIKYFFNEENGITSLVDKKYISRNKKLIIETLKDWTSIIVPVITTTISLYLVIIQNISDKEIKQLKQSMKKQELTIKQLENLTNNKVVSDKK